MSLTYNGRNVKVGTFPSMNSLLEFLQTTPLKDPEMGCSDVVLNYPKRNNQWMGVRSKEHLFNMAKYGSDNTKALEELKEVTTNPVCINKMRRGRKLWSDCGDDADVSRYFMGDWDCMSYKPLEPSPSKTIKVFASISVCGATDPEDMIRAGKVLVQKLCALSMEGYSIRLEAGLATQYPRGDYGILSILIKDEADDFDPARIAYALMEPSFLRGLGIAYLSRTFKGYGGSCGALHNSTAKPVAKLALGDDYTVISLADIIDCYTEKEMSKYIDECLSESESHDF